jgi:GGDEF domain-containing protein
VEAGGAHHRLSASIGFAIDAGTTEPDALIRAADEAAYRVKHGGGGRPRPRQ